MPTEQPLADLIQTYSKKALLAEVITRRDVELSTMLEAEAMMPVLCCCCDAPGTVRCDRCGEFFCPACADTAGGACTDAGEFLCEECAHKLEEPRCRP
jgi:hypothetical protein